LLRDDNQKGNDSSKGNGTFDAGVSATLGGDRVQEFDQRLGGLFAVFAGDLVVGYEADGVGAYGAA
jgi:hypothetical protein